MGHNPPRTPVGFRPKTVADAHWAGQPVAVHCIACGHSRSANAWHIFHGRGNIQFGTLQRGFFCGKCARSSIVVVLPFDAPTPWDWVRDPRNPETSDDDKRKILRSAEHLPWRIDAWNEAGDIEKLLAKVDDESFGREVLKIARRFNNSAAKLTLRDGLLTYAEDPMTP